MPNLNLTYITDGATAIGRWFGRERPGLIDVLHRLASAGTPAGARLAAAGLTEKAIVSWRRNTRVRPAPPLLTVERVGLTPDVERLVAGVLQRGPILNLGRACALFGADVVTWPDAEEPDIDDLLDTFAVDRARLSAELARSEDDRASFPFPRPYPRLNIYSHPEHLVFVPVGPRGDGFSRELPSLAVHAGTDLSPAELGDQLLAAFRPYGHSEEASAPPYWKELGFKTETAFLRRARCVSTGQGDFSVSFSPTAHLGRVRYDILSTRTPVYAPIDERASLGNALRAAIDGSHG